MFYSSLTIIANVALTQPNPLQAETIPKANPKLLSQFQHCENSGIPFAAVFGDSELQEGIVTLRDMETREELKACVRVCVAAHDICSHYGYVRYVRS